MNNIDYIQSEVLPRTSYDFVEDVAWVQAPIEPLCPDIVNGEVPYIKYDPNADFQYATSQRITTDGTFLFLIEARANILRKVVDAKTYYTQLDISNIKSVDDFQYIIGDIVQCIEHGDFGTKEKPWLGERITTFLPIKMVIKEK